MTWCSDGERCRSGPGALKPALSVREDVYHKLQSPMPGRCRGIGAEIGCQVDKGLLSVGEAEGSMMNETAICSMEGCGKVAEIHHALRDRHPFNKSRAQSATGVKWRDEPHLVQDLCREHHFDGFHQKFARTDNWPPGWGFADTPLLRGADAVERIVDRASARPSTGHGNSSDRKLRGRRDDGGFANSVLYRLCSEHHSHSDVGIVEAKLRLIGDHYRASLKRGVGAHHADDGDGFFVELARAVASSDLDERLDQVRREGRVSLRTLPLVVAAHADFEATVVSFTRSWLGPEAARRVINRRSFCSKYLHFHARDSFFIYDSVVLGRLGLGRGTSYARFADEILRYAVSGHSQTWTPRSVDMEIYGYQVVGKL